VVSVKHKKLSLTAKAQVLGAKILHVAVHDNHDDDDDDDDNNNTNNNN
jgi:hypothetical protein